MRRALTFSTISSYQRGSNPDEEVTTRRPAKYIGTVRARITSSGRLARDVPGYRYHCTYSRQRNTGSFVDIRWLA